MLLSEDKKKLYGPLNYFIQHNINQFMERNAFMTFFNNVNIRYYIADKALTSDEFKDLQITSTFTGLFDNQYSINVYKYSEVTSDYNIDFTNNFKINGHDLNKEFLTFTGNFIQLEINFGNISYCESDFVYITK